MTRGTSSRMKKTNQLNIHVMITLQLLHQQIAKVE